MNLAPLHSTLLRTLVIVLTLSFILYLPAKAQRGLGLNADGDVLSGSNSSSGGIIRQDGWMMAFNGGYESPLGDVKESYKGGPTYGINVLRRMGHFVYSGTIDYRSYNPIHAGESYYDGTDFYTTKFSTYNGLGLYLGLAYEIPVGNAYLYGGVNGGTMLVSYKIDVNGANVSGSEEVAGAQSNYLGPKLGINFMLSDKLGLSLEGRYSLSVTSVDISTRNGTTVDNAFNSYAGNIFLTYSF